MKRKLRGDRFKCGADLRGGSRADLTMRIGVPERTSTRGRIQHPRQVELSQRSAALRPMYELPQLWGLSPRRRDRTRALAATAGAVPPLFRDRIHLRPSRGGDGLGAWHARALDAMTSTRMRSGMPPAPRVHRRSPAQQRARRAVSPSIEYTPHV